MNTIFSFRPWMLATAAVATLTACGGAEITESNSPEAQITENSGDSLSLTSKDPSKDQLNAVLLIQIERPYCRNGEPKDTITHQICTGTVISDRHVLTAAHCFVSNCPTAAGMEPVRLSGIKIPRSPTSDMTRFNWSDPTKVISARNVAVSKGFNGRSSRVLMKVANAYDVIRKRERDNKGIFTQDDSYFTKTSDDVAVIDFGAGSLKAGRYPASRISGRINGKKEFDLSNDKFTPIGYIGTDKNPNALIRESRPLDTTLDRRMVSFVSELLGDSKKIAFSAPADPKAGPSYGLWGIPYDYGCWGDSGSPAFFNGKIVGIASTTGRSPRRVLARCGDRNLIASQGNKLAQDESANVMYVELDPADITNLQTTANSLNLSKTVKIDVDLWSLANEFDDVDNNLSAAERADRFVASSSGNFTVSGTLPDGTSAWTQLAQPVTSVTSQTPGGTIRQTFATGSGARTATWNFTGLSPGFYRVEILYPRHPGNANCVQVLTKSTKDTIFIARKNRLNQQLGTGITSLSTNFSNTRTDVTLLADGKTTDYIMVHSASTGGLGTLSVRLSDAGCTTGGRIVADTVRLTGITTTRTNR